MGVPYHPAACVCPRVRLSELFSDFHKTSTAHTCSFPTFSNNDMAVVPIFEAGAILAPPIFRFYNVLRSRDCSVGIETRYGLGGPEIESQGGGCRFSAPLQTGCEAHPASYTVGTGAFPGVKRPGRGVEPPPHLAPRLKKSRAIPLLLLWAFVACSRVTFTFTFYPAQMFIGL